MKQIEFEKSIYDPQGNPLDYPGDIISNPLFISDGRYQQIKHSDDFCSFYTSEGSDIRQILQQKNVPAIPERIAQVAFGANRNLENIAWKLREYKRTDNRISQDFIALPAYINHADVVACNIGYWGYVYSGLLTTHEHAGIRQYLLGTKCPVVVLLLDKMQLAAIHHSEGVVIPGQTQPGVSCGISDIQVHLHDSVTCIAQAYSLSLPFLSLDGEYPIAFETVKTENRGDYPSMSQAEMFYHINRCIHAEQDIDGKLPIADTLRCANLLLLQRGVCSTREMEQHPLYAEVRTALLEHYTLKDGDGIIRNGLSDIYPVRSAEDNWKPSPLYNPIAK